MAKYTVEHIQGEQGYGEATTTFRSIEARSAIEAIYKVANTQTRNVQGWKARSADHDRASLFNLDAPNTSEEYCDYYWAEIENDSDQEPDPQTEIESDRDQASDPQTGNDGSDNIRFRKPGAGGTFSFEDQGKLKAQWAHLPAGVGCACDFYSSYSFFEWLAKQKVIRIESPSRFQDENRFAGFRFFAQRIDPTNVIQSLILFDEVYVNLQGYYAEYSNNIEVLSKYGFIKHYPNPQEPSFLKIYALIKPVIVRRMHSIFMNNYKVVRFEELWTDPRIGKQFGNYEGLFSWLYDQYALAACGKPSRELGLF